MGQANRMTPLAEFSNYDELVTSLRVCRDQRDISFELLDLISGLPPGYSAKLLGPRPIRRIGLQSLGDLLGGLGIKGLFVDDPEALALVQGRFVARDRAHLASALGGFQALNNSRRAP